MNKGPATPNLVSPTGQNSAEKVLRRARMTRVAASLKSRLALASYKTQHGLENCNFKALESLPLPDAADHTIGSASLLRRADDGQLRKYVLAEQLKRGSPVQRASLIRKRPRSAAAALGSDPVMAPPNALAISSQSAPSSAANGRQTVPLAKESEPSFKVEEPSTPPPSQQEEDVRPAEPSTPKHQQLPGDAEGANLLMYLAKSAGRTPRTPDFNFNEYCNFFTPSPSVTRVGKPVTPHSISRVRQHLNFENA